MTEKANTYAYRVGNGIYINLTNRCTNDCTFCIRNNADGAYGSDSLWLEHEPSAQEALDAIRAIWFPECEEFVFCGYGEPLMRWEVLLETASLLKQSYCQPIRINTNGQSELFCGKDITPSFAGLIDRVSVSLNTPGAEEYIRLCHPVYGRKAFDAMLHFTECCTHTVPDVRMTVVREMLNKFQLALCESIATRCGATLRVRTYIGKNGQ